jgi:hypothetical protein
MRLALVFALVAPSAYAQTPAPAVSPWTLRPAHVECADRPVTAQTLVTPVLQISGVQRGDQRTALGIGETAVLSGSAGLTVGQRVVARRLSGGPDSFKRSVDGYGALHTAGWLTVTALDARFALARVDAACDIVEVGDTVEPATEVALPVAAQAGAPQFADRASVLFGMDRRSMFADGDVLSFDRGSANGIMPGARVVLYRDQHNGLPLVELGEAVVVDVAPTNAKAVVVRVSDVIYSGDVAVIRAAP